MISDNPLQELEVIRQEKTKKEAEVKAEEEKAKALEDEAKGVRRHADELKRTIPALAQKEDQLKQQINLKVNIKPR